MEKQKNKFLLWLEPLQQESWQLELLISSFFAFYAHWSTGDISHFCP